VPRLPFEACKFQPLFILQKGTPLKIATVAGVVLILLGIVGFTMGGFSFTHEKKDVDMGPIQIEHKQHKTIPISPALSLVAVVGGLVLVVAGSRSK
jgi:uncharacterized membrane protein YidH (DUF202 family)